MSANIVSKYTAYVGVDKERPDKITGEIKKTDIPIAPKKVRILVIQRPRFIGIRKHVSVELMMACFQRGGNLVVPSGYGGAVHYGGANFDAMDAWKYIGGKTAMLPPGSYPYPNKIHKN